MNELPEGTVTLLLADIEGSTRLWEADRSEMAAALGRLDSVLDEVVPRHGGVRPLEQGEGDSFVVAFALASSAVACALELQLAELAPIRLRVGLHTGEAQLRDDANYFGPTINRTARLRDLAHGGQTVISGATEAMVIDYLPDGAWLSDLGAHVLRDLPRPERVVQLCHPELRNDFPALLGVSVPGPQRLPLQLTSFVGRRAQIGEIRDVIEDVHRLVTLTGAGGVGKTRLSLEVAAGLSADVVFADLAPVTDPATVAVIVARALGQPDQPGRSTTDTIVSAIGERHLLLLLDNCEHLVEASVALIVDVLGECPHVTVLATSREPLGVAGELIWRVPSLSLADEALELFAERARLVRPDFFLCEDNTGVVAEICRRLDGIPLAIELAAARLRALSAPEIRDSLHDRFRLLTGGSRAAVRRQQTLRASVDWSHALLTQPERVLFRRLGVFMGGFDLDAARFVAAGDDVHSHQVLDLLSLLVDKSLVVSDDGVARSRYRLLETVRQYAQEKLGESGEADAVRDRHRDHYSMIASAIDAQDQRDRGRRIDRAAREIDNLRAAFAWSSESRDRVPAHELASSLLPLWLAHGRLMEGLAWFSELDRMPAGEKLPPAVHARTLADKAMLGAWMVGICEDDARQALDIARRLDDPSLLLRALTACGAINAFSPDAAQQYMDEAAALARELDDRWRLSQVLAFKEYAALLAGDLEAAIVAGTEGGALADDLEDRFGSRMCRVWLGVAMWMRGDLARATDLIAEVTDEADAEGDVIHGVVGRISMGHMYAYAGNHEPALAAAWAAVETTADMGAFLASFAYGALAVAALAAGELEIAAQAGVDISARIAVEHMMVATTNVGPMAQVALLRGDLDSALRYANAAVAASAGWHLMTALTVRARVALARGEYAPAEVDAQSALALALEIQSEQGVPDILELLAVVARNAESDCDAARFAGAADSIRGRLGFVRFKVYEDSYLTWQSHLHDALGDSGFDSAWAAGAALSTPQAIAYARRGRGERKRPPTGWESLTPTERDVVRLVVDGLGNRDIAARLFVSHRTVQTHLTHVYAKLGLTSRVALAQEAGRRLSSEV